MRAFAAIGLVVSFVFGMLAILQITTLQDNLEGVSNSIGTLAQQITSLSVIAIVGVLGIGLVLAAVGYLAGRP